MLSLQDTLSLFCRQLLSCETPEQVLRLFTETMHLRCALLGSINKEDNIFSTSEIICNGTIENNYTIPLSSSIAQLLSDAEFEKSIDLSSSINNHEDPVKDLFPFSFCTGISFHVHGTSELYVLLVFNDTPFHNEDTTQLLFSKTMLSLQYLKNFSFKTSVSDKSRFIEQTRSKMVSMSHMAGRIAHDFNNVIGAIGGYSSLLKKKLGEDHPDIRYVTNIMNAASNGSEMTNQLSLVVKNVPQLKDSIDVHSTISAVLTLLRDNDENKTTISSTFNAHKYHILGDGILFQQVLLNLGQNALVACEENHGTVFFSTADVHIKKASPLCTHFSIKPGDAICISVKDNGSGISQENSNRIFDPYFTTLPKGKGDGLGLSFLWMYIETFGGAIEFSTTPGEGTTFKLYFSTALPDNEQNIDSRTFQKNAAISSILIVDDEPSIREIYTEILHDHGYKVFSVCDGSEVIPFLEKTTTAIDLVLLDMVMPKMNGIETFKALRARYKDIPILFMSGLATSSSLSSLLEEPATAFFDKSKDYSHLINIIKERF